MKLDEVSIATGDVASDLWRCNAVERSVCAILIVVLPESFHSSLQIIGIPEQTMVKEFAAQGTDQSLDAGVRQGHLRNRFDLLVLLNAQIRLPAVVWE